MCATASQKCTIYYKITRLSFKYMYHYVLYLSYSCTEKNLKIEWEEQPDTKSEKVRGKAFSAPCLTENNGT